VQANLSHGSDNAHLPDWLLETRPSHWAPSSVGTAGSRAATSLWCDPLILFGAEPIQSDPYPRATIRDLPALPAIVVPRIIVTLVVAAALLAYFGLLQL
jgi:hypothetical protein